MAIRDGEYKRKPAKKKPKVKCGCGHYPEDHYLKEGACAKCGCTWYHPNDTYILAKKKA